MLNVFLYHSNHDFIDLCKNFLPLSTYFLFGLQLDLSKSFCLSYRRVTHGNVLKISMAHNNNQNLLWYLLINCIFARSLPEVSSLKYDSTFHFLNLLMIGWCNSPANCRVVISKGRYFRIIWLLIANLFFRVRLPPSHNIYKPLKQVHFDIHHVSDF